jgi:hypothetical protein
MKKKLILIWKLMFSKHYYIAFFEGDKTIYRAMKGMTVADAENIHFDLLGKEEEAVDDNQQDLNLQEVMKIINPKQ